MTYQNADELHLAYNPERGYFHFVLYVEPPVGPGSALNGTQVIREGGPNLLASTSPYAQEWMARLRPTTPNALHVSLVADDDVPKLWHPCVYDDTASPAAVAGSGCLCWQTFTDPITQLPVVAHHRRNVGPNPNYENWMYYTYAPLALPAAEHLASLVIDVNTELFWVRTSSGSLHIAPEDRRSGGYSVGYGGTGPDNLALWIEQVVASDGRDITGSLTGDRPGGRVRAWTSSKAAKRTQELSLGQLETLCRTGAVA